MLLRKVALFMQNGIDFSITNTFFVWLLIGLNALVAIAVMWALVRLKRLSDLQREVQELRAGVSGTKDNAELIDRRLIQLLTQTSDDAATLRENLVDRVDQVRLQLSREMGDERSRSQEQANDLKDQLKTYLAANQHALEIRHSDISKQLNDSVITNFQALGKQLNDVLSRNTTDINTRVETLTQTTDRRMREIAGQVDQRLSEGFEKTNATFTDIVKRLALIDEAQKKITELSGEVVGLQKILDDKRSRGAFGEIQLANLIENFLPAANFSLQHTLPNGRIADCVLFLPPPTGTIAIDSKFPLESYQRLMQTSPSESERGTTERQFKQDIRKHIRDISERYIVPNVTADGAMMFIPAEAVFAEIQANHQDLVEQAHQARVWIVSPTTMWAILNTATVILKEAERREQVDLIQLHLNKLGEDFSRFQQRMDKLAIHIRQANDDMQRVQTSAQKIVSQFDKIEQVELEKLQDGND